MASQKIAVAFVMLFAGIGLTQTKNELAISYSLDTLVNQALSRSDKIAAQKARVEEKKEAALQAGAWKNPNLNLNAGAKLASSQAGPAFDIKLSQEFMFPGKQQLRSEVADFNKQLMEIEFAETELSLITDVILLAYEYSLQARKVELAQKRKSRFKLLQSYLAGHTFASPQQKTTSLIVKERLRNIEAEEKQLEGELKSYLAQLSLYVDINVERIPAIVVPWLKGHRSISEEDWLAKVRESNLMLASQKIEITKAKKEEVLLKKEVWPDFSVSAFYNQERAVDTERAFGLGIEFSLPLWNRNQAALSSVHHRIVAEDRLLLYKDKQTIAHAKALLADYQASRNVALQYPENAIAMLQSNLHAMEKEFRKNRVDFLLFLELDVQAAQTSNLILAAQLSLLRNIVSLSILAKDTTALSALHTY